MGEEKRGGRGGVNDAALMDFLRLSVFSRVPSISIPL